MADTFSIDDAYAAPSTPPAGQGDGTFSIDDAYAPANPAHGGGYRAPNGKDNLPRAATNAEAVALGGAVLGPNDKPIDPKLAQLMGAGPPAKEKFAEGHELAGHLNALLAGTAQGADFGLTDELGASIRGTINVLNGGEYGPAYDQALQTARENLARLQAAAPKTFVAGELAGGVGTAVAAPVKLVAAAPSLAAKVATSSAIGAGTGAAYGFGNSEGGANNRIEGAVSGAIPGAILGGAAPLVAAAAPPIIAAGKALFRTATPEQRAVSLIARAAGRSGVSPGDFEAAIRAGNAKGVPLVPADMGPSLTRLGRTVETVPGQGSELATDFLTERQADQGKRLLGQLRTHLGDPADYWKSMDELDAARRSAAKPLYDAAYARPAVDTWSPELAGLLNRPSMKDAYARAARIAAEEGRDPKELGLTFNEAGDPMFLVGADATGKIPSTQTLDYVKRGLDDVVESFRNPTTGKLALDESGRAINNTRGQFVSMLRDGNPDYAAALDSWAGPSHAMDVLGRARDFARGDIEMTAKQFADMTPADQQLARVGVARELQKIINGSDDGINKVRRIFGSPNKRDTLHLFFPDEASWEHFSAIMGAENQMAKNAQSITGGSVTGRIGAEQADAADKAGDVLAGVVTGGVRGGIAKVRDIFMNGARGIDEPTTIELAKRLFSSDPGKAAALAQELRSVIASRKGLISVGQRRILTALGGAQATGVPLLSQQREPAQHFSSGGVVTEHKDLRSLLADKRPLKQILAEAKARQAHMADGGVVSQPKGGRGVATQQFSAVDPSLAPTVQAVFAENPALARHSADYAVITGKPMAPGTGQLESYPPEELYNPIPGKATTEVYNQDPAALKGLITGDMLHRLGAVDTKTGQPVDQGWQALKTSFLQTMTPQQQADNQRVYGWYQAKGDPRSFEQFMDQSRGDEYLMGALTPDAGDYWRGRPGSHQPSMYTPQQDEILNKMRGYLKGYATGGVVTKPLGTGHRDSPVKVIAAHHAAIAGDKVAAATPGQKDAGNYAHGHIAWNGLQISIETPKGGTRTAKDGAWEVPNFPAHYGYLKRTVGADHEHVDVFFGDHPESQRVWVIDQVDPATRKFDEHKVMLACMTPKEARDLYAAAFSDGSGHARVGAFTMMTVKQFKNWLKRGKRTKPLGHLPPPRSGASRAAQTPTAVRQLRPTSGNAALVANAIGNAT